MSTAARASGLYIDGEWRDAAGRIEVLDKYSGDVLAGVAEATPADAGTRSPARTAPRRARWTRASAPASCSGWPT
ncbi:hypothetical protein ACFQ0B_24575 [Nonomuraea thailandensis]